jgi:hypothetical protein
MTERRHPPERDIRLSERERTSQPSEMHTPAMIASVHPPLLLVARGKFTRSAA